MIFSRKEKKEIWCIWSKIQ